ncbi:NAD-dependent succinate-semialdehyde dehydrogenase [Novosphingobium percolationis]|uniref:NAD-dependent succinate-semialdehyde dehydrogenase n=1 Tax=Novosphingobium percolationis TaxID=2871811 RepID=UPI001CD726C1|nr:NAD-dependent succinate-semialdehyde dehydrogenase [Novosphingobium percolationis]
MYESLALLIDGQFIAEGRATIAVENPATGTELARLPVATTEDLDRAVAAASRAFPAWRDTSAFERGQVLRRAAQIIRERADAIATTLTLEQGKPLAEARGEVLVSADIFDWAAEEARRVYGRIVPGRVPGVRQMVVHEAVGVAALFTPWNFPALTPARKLAAALAAGCTTILKAAEETPGTAVAFARALVEAGAPAGTVNLVFGDPAAISAHLIAQTAVRKVSFTGSTPVGKHLLRLCADGVKRTTMELGGNAPVIVTASADLDAAVAASAASKFRNAGQVCISPSRFFVHESLYPRFVAGMTAAAQDVRVGDGLSEGVTMGPLASARRVTAMEEAVADAVARGAKLECGGQRIGNRGHFFAPTVISGVPADATLLTCETFGPIAPMTSFTDLSDVIARGNSVEAGLAAYAFSQDRAEIAALMKGIEAGIVGINGFAVSTPETPFGGVKESGHGQEGGAEGLEAYLNVKFISES